MTSQQKKNKVKELQHFLKELEKYLSYILLYEKKGFTKQQATEALELQSTLLGYVGRFKGLITELTGKDKVIIRRRPKGLPVEESSTDMWLEASKIPYGSLTREALLYCIDVTRVAVGRFELDIEQGIRDDQGNPIRKPVKNKEEIRPGYPVEQKTLLSVTSGKANWKAIEIELGMTKMGFGRKIYFVTDPFKRDTIFRDVEQAFVLASSGFSKPSVILAGSVIEELLRLYLECKNISPISDNFDGYIRTCEQHGLLKDSVSRLSHSVRQFRNLVHLSAEENKKHTLSKATAIGAVSSIFTIATDF